LNKCSYGDDIEVEMGGACRTHGRDEKLTQSLSKFLNGREPLERFGERLEGNINSIMKQIIQHRGHRRAFVNTVMNFGVFKMRLISRTAVVTQFSRFQFEILVLDGSLDG
jgi:hypothetical protein